ncbi:MAG: flagellar assembly protein FliW [Pseudomonadota bacterium]
MTETTGSQPADAPTSVSIKTLFGQREFQWDKAIYMPTGLTGFENHNVFALANFPGDTTGCFKLLQSLTEPELAFVVAPYNAASGVIKESHVTQMLSSVAIAPDDAAILFIVTLYKDENNGEALRMSVNLRAPIIIDTERQVAWQRTLPYEEYPYRKMLDS